MEYERKVLFTSKQGFSLVELLVVIAVITVLAFVGVTVFRGITSSASDTKRKNDIKAIASALEGNYQVANGQYPNLLLDQYFSAGKPVPPEGGDYNFFTNANNGGFRVCAALDGHPPGTLCDTSSSTCFCVESTQSQYIASGSTPTPTTVVSTSTPVPTPTAIPCALTSAFWGVTSITEGNVVDLTAVGDASHCAIGTQVDFEVRRNGTIIDDISALVQPLSGTMNSLHQATATWIAEFNPFIPGTNPQYYFKANVHGDLATTIDTKPQLLTVLPTPSAIPTPSPTPLPTNTPTPIPPTSTPIPPTSTPTPVTANFYAGAGDGYIDNGGPVGLSWSVVHDASVGSAADYIATNVRVQSGYPLGGSPTNIRRGFVPVDTSAIPDNATIISATFNFYVILNNNGDNDGNDFLGLVQTTQASTSSLIMDDYDQDGAISNPVEGATRIDYGNLTLNAYNALTLNPTGLSWINKTGITRLGFREGHDILNDPYVGAANTYNQMRFYSSEQTGIAQDPYLTITYSY